MSEDHVDPAPRAFAVSGSLRICTVDSASALMLVEPLAVATNIIEKMELASSVAPAFL